jgi:hypothetical protein
MPETPPPAGEVPATGHLLPLAPSFSPPPLEAPPRRAPSRSSPARRTPPRQPLPDAVAVRRVTVPESAPPYDDERPGAGRQGERAGLAGPRQPARLARPDQDPSVPRPEQCPAVRRPDQDPAVPASWPSRFAQVLAETLAGSRPPRQITPWATEQARRQLRQLGPMLSAGQPGRQPRVRRVLACSPAADVLELAAVVAFGPQVRALAVRLERAGPQPGGPGREPVGPRWQCTVVESA